MTNPTPEYYQYTYRRKLTASDMANREVVVKLDPYRIAAIYDLGGGPREQIVKKGLRWTNKDKTEREVLLEIKAACDRGLEMLEEDAE